jgi:hypothetical protein
MLREDGVLDIVKSPGLFTTRVTSDDRTTLPRVPVILSEYVPGGVEPLVVTESVELPLPATDDGLKEPVAPAGNPVTLNAIVPPAKSTPGTMLAVYVPPPPGATVCEAGVALTRKSGVSKNSPLMTGLPAPLSVTRI